MESGKSFVESFNYRHRLRSYECRAQLELDIGLIGHTNLPLCASFLLQWFALQLISLPLFGPGTRKWINVSFAIMKCSLNV